MKFIEKYISFINRLNTKIGYLVSWLTFILVLITCYDVFTRYILNESSAALPELEWHLFAVIFLMGGSYTLIANDHVRVDILYSKFSEKKKAWINFLGAVLFLIPFCILIIYSSQDFVISSFKFKEVSADPGGLPARYIIKSFIPISFIFLLLQGFSLAFKSFIEIKNNKRTK